jgi:hypothetical protein
MDQETNDKNNKDEEVLEIVPQLPEVTRLKIMFIIQLVLT